MVDSISKYNELSLVAVTRLAEPKWLARHPNTNASLLNCFDGHLLASGLYNITSALQGYSLQSNPDEDAILARSQYLMSLGINPYQDISPKILRTVFEPSRIFYINFSR